MRETTAEKRHVFDRAPVDTPPPPRVELTTTEDLLRKFDDAVEKGRDLDEGEGRQVVQSLVKQRRDSIEQFRKGGRQDLADKELAEIRVLESYLPPAADPAAVERAVAEAIAETGAAAPRDMGRVMKAAMAKLAGQSVDGKAVNELVKKKLSSG